MKVLLSSFLLITCSLSYAQNPVGFEEMCNSYLQGSINTATSTQLKFELDRDSSIIILDAREKEEYDVSHIPNSIHVGYDNFRIDSLFFLDKNSKIYVYCSIGYRSEKIGEILEIAEYKWILNLYGGIFDWSNNGYPLIDNNGDTTTAIHGYDDTWGQWINDSSSFKVGQ